MASVIRSIKLTERTGIERGCRWWYHQDVMDLLEIGKTVGEMVSVFIDGSEGKNENQNSDIISHGSGAYGSWNEEQNSGIIIHGGGVSGGW